LRSVEVGKGRDAHGAAPRGCIFDPRQILRFAQDDADMDFELSADG
jgi:hypothetical protein